MARGGRVRQQAEACLSRRSAACQRNPDGRIPQRSHSRRTADAGAEPLYSKVDKIALSSITLLTLLLLSGYPLGIY